MSDKEYVDTKGLAEIFGIAASTWNKRRLLGGQETPPFTKIGRSVRYHIPTVTTVDGGSDASLHQRSTCELGGRIISWPPKNENPGAGATARGAKKFGLL